jgi:hypothetical protein
MIICWMVYTATLVHDIMMLTLDEHPRSTILACVFVHVTGVRRTHSHAVESIHANMSYAAPTTTCAALCAIKTLVV